VQRDISPLGKGWVNGTWGKMGVALFWFIGSARLMGKPKGKPWSEPIDKKRLLLEKKGRFVDGSKPSGKEISHQAKDNHP